MASGYARNATIVPRVSLSIQCILGPPRAWPSSTPGSERAEGVPSLCAREGLLSPRASCALRSHHRFVARSKLPTRLLTPKLSLPLDPSPRRRYTLL